MAGAHEARRAERRYKAIDPDNRVVARTLESEWEASLQDLEHVKSSYEDAKRERRVQLSDHDRTKIRALAQNLPAVWHAPTTQPADRKAMLRIAIEVVAIRPIDVPERLTHIRVQWRSGAVDELSAPRPSQADQRRTSSAAVDRIRELAALGLHDEVIAERLNGESLVTGAGQSWIGQAVKRVRLAQAILRVAATRPTRLPVPDRHPDGRYSICGVAKRFGVSEMVVYRWIKCGIVQGTCERFELYKRVWWLDINETTSARLEQVAACTRRPTRRHIETMD